MSFLMLSRAVRQRPGPQPAHCGRNRSSAALAPLVGLILLAGCAQAPSLAAQPATHAEGANQVTVSVSPSASPTAVLLPDAATLTARLTKVSTKGIGAIGQIVTLPDGTLLTDRSGGKALIPASTMKVMTTMAALDILGPDRTFSTRVVDAGSGRIILVGGGDPLLTDKTSKSKDKLASLQNLAAATVTALKQAGRTTVSLGYDASLFTGPRFSPHWKAKWKGYEAQVTALQTNSGLINSWRADPNPPKSAATAFAQRLRKAGIRVTSIRPAKAPSSASELASVTSATVAAIIERTLKISDNVGAETLSRQAAIASGATPSFSGAAGNVKAWLVKHGLWADGQVILDGSGLSPKNRLVPAMLAKAIQTALGYGEFTPILDGLPIGGVDGTLKGRFDDPSEKAGVGVVHAKTGTLTGVAGLVGYLTTADGAQVVFAELANKAVSYRTSYNWLDREAAAIAGCGCS